MNLPGSTESNFRLASVEASEEHSSSFSYWCVGEIHSESRNISLALIDQNRRRTRLDKWSTPSLKLILNSWESTLKNKWKNWTRKIKCWLFTNDSSPKRTWNWIFRRCSSLSSGNSSHSRFQPDLFRMIRRLTSIRHETTRRLQQLNHYEQVKQKMQEVAALIFRSDFFSSTRKSSNTRKPTNHCARWPSLIVSHP